MIPLPRPDNRLYLGRGGTGKTSLALEHAEAFRRRIVVCPIDDQAPRMGCDQVTADRAELVRLAMQPSFAVCFTPGELGAENWEWANEAAWRAGDTLIIWDEVGMYFRTDGGSLKGFAYKLWMAGRHRRCRVFATSQRPARVPRDCTANLARAIVFHTSEPNDLRFYRNMSPPVTTAAIGELDAARYEALDWTPTGTAKRKAPFP